MVMTCTTTYMLSNSHPQALEVIHNLTLHKRSGARCSSIHETRERVKRSYGWRG
jgi:hypothetical protein